VKQPKPFSKEYVDSPTVDNDESCYRSGFLDHVKITKAEARKAVPHMAAFYPTKSTLERTGAGGNPAHPEFKGGGEMPEMPRAFSKTIIKGGPAHPGTPG
jgi:hypothetical protein